MNSPARDGVGGDVFAGNNLDPYSDDVQCRQEVEGQVKGAAIWWIDTRKICDFLHGI